MTAPAPTTQATVLALHHGYRIAGGEERAAAQLADLAEAQLGEQVAWVRRDSTRISASEAARGLLAGGTGASQVTEALESTGADLLHAHNLFPTFGPAALRAARDAGAAVVVHLHNYRLVCAVATNVRDGHDCTECHRGKASPGLRHRCRGSFAEAAAYAAALPRWQSAVLELADVVIVPSAAARARLLDLGLGLPADRVHIIGGVATQVAERSPASTGRFALLVTRLAPEKDVRTAIDACRIAGLPLVIAGDGPERAALEAYAGPAPAGASATRASSRSAPRDDVATPPHPGSTGAGSTDARDLPTPPAGQLAPPSVKPRSLYRGAARRSDSVSAPVRRPATPPPPREFPEHLDPFLSQATPPPSTAPPKPHEKPARWPAPTKKPPVIGAAAAPSPSSEVRAAAAPAPSSEGASPREQHALEALLGSEVLALLDGEPSLRGNTVFVGRASETVLAALRARASVGLATSVAHETFGLSALESMAAALPTAGSAVGALPELLGDDCTVNPGDPAALAALISRLAGSDAAGLAAAQRASAHASPQLVASRLRAAYAAARDQSAGRSAYR